MKEEKDSLAKELKKELCWDSPLAADIAREESDKMEQLCNEYRVFLDAAKTEREAAAYSEELLKAAGYKAFAPGTKYLPGDKIYTINRKKCVIAATIGTEPLEQGFRLNVSHIDSPRLDLRPLPLYEKSDMAFLKTHYYGGIRKYQWTAIPLAMHGVVCLKNGESVTISVGEKENDPVFCITDLLPHLSARQNERRLPEGVKGEELNILFGSAPLEDEDAKERIKLNILRMLNRYYGMTEKDFIRAEIELVPAHKAREVGLDCSMIGAYGQDDRVDAFPALRAEMETVNPAHTTVCVLSDKEEIGSEGVTGMNSQYAFHFLQQLCAGQEADYIAACQESKCLSADVTAAYDPNWADAYEPSASSYLGKGVAICKYTGARGKSGASDASAELTAWLADLLDENNVAWQIGELGKIDLGGGGTVAKFVAGQNIDTVDIGVPVLSMHSPFEVASKYDIYMAYKAFKVFAES